MAPLPKISIVVPSLNQAPFLGETLQSLVDQQYPDLEVIVQDGGSSDESVAVAEGFAKRFPQTFRLLIEKDLGQADALNRGFARTSGEILGFLNSDDTLLPRVLHRVAAEIGRERDRLIVMGRCTFTGTDPWLTGREHPSRFRSHFDQLAIWKRGYNTIPQPSVFWHRSVWERCGGFDIQEEHALDYDLFCRFSKCFPFHAVDQVWSTYRTHPASKSARRTQAEVLEICIRISRKYWGPWHSLLRWRCEASYSIYRLRMFLRRLGERARGMIRRLLTGR